MTASCQRIHSHSLVPARLVSQFHTQRSRYTVRKKQGRENKTRTQKQKGRRRPDILEGTDRLRVSPSPGQKIDLDERVGVAVVVSLGQVPGLQDVDDQVSQVPVVVDLELREKQESRPCKRESELRLYWASLVCRIWVSVPEFPL